MSVVFDFTSLPFQVSQVTFEFAELIGNVGLENLQVNGESMFVGQLPNAPTDIAQGVTLTVEIVQRPNVISGTVTLAGPINSLLIGGQELWIDNVTARSQAPASDIVINEILYDPNYDDFGTERIEMKNVGPDSISLDNTSLFVTRGRRYPHHELGFSTVAEDSPWRIACSALVGRGG